MAEDDRRDMTPQGLADAVDELARGLPAGGRPPSSGWQRVLGEQALNRLLEVDPVVRAALLAGLQRLFEDEGALRGAVAAACEVERFPNLAEGEHELPRPGADGVTEYLGKPFGQLLLLACARAEETASIEAFRRGREADRGSEG